MNHGSHGSSACRKLPRIGVASDSGPCSLGTAGLQGVRGFPMLRPMPESDAVNRRLTPLCAAFAAMTLAASAHAELLYEFTFNATVTEKWGDNPDHPWGGVEIGDPAYFKYVIDVEQPDQLPQSSLTGMYELHSAEISYGGIAVQPGFVTEMLVDLFNPGADQLVKIVAR